MDSDLRGSLTLTGELGLDLGPGRQDLTDRRILTDPIVGMIALVPVIEFGSFSVIGS